MRPTVYFPELRFDDVFVPAQSACGVEASSPRTAREITTRETRRIENVEAAKSLRRQPAFDSTVIEA
jgi:hypothetical protein